MREQGSWSLSLGQWGSLHVRLHMFFFLFAAFAFYLSWVHAQMSPGKGSVWIAIVSLTILLASVLLHEMGHFLVTLRCGGSAERIVLGPLGGLSPMKVPGQGHAEMLVYLAGPAVNAAVCLLAGIFVLALEDQVYFAALLHPLHPTLLLDGSGLVISLKLVFWINWLLLLINLLPAFPFDGGRALRAGLVTLWPELGRRRAATMVTGAAKIVALGLVIAAYFVWDQKISAGPMPAWFAILLLGIFMFFCAKHEEDRQEEPESDDHLFGYDFSQGYTSLERSSEPPVATVKANFIVRWFEQRREARMRRKLLKEAEEEQRVDEILGRLHREGLQSLSHEDRLLLQRVSARYRSRHGHNA